MTPAEQRATEKIKECCDLAALVQHYIPLRKTGAAWMGKCPFHGGGKERTGSFEVSANGLFHCFSCSAAGDAFTFIQRIEGVSFMEARRILGQRYGICLDGLSTASEIAAARRQRAYAQKIEAECAWFWRWLAAWLERCRPLYQEAATLAETWLERYGYLRRDVRASRLLAAIGAASPVALAGAYRRVRGAAWVAAAREKDMGEWNAFQELRAMLREDFAEYIAEWRRTGIEPPPNPNPPYAMAKWMHDWEAARIGQRSGGTILICFDGDAAGRAGALRAAEMMA